MPTTVQVTGAILDPAGQPIVATVRLTPRPARVLDAGGGFIYRYAETSSDAGTGEFAVGVIPGGLDSLDPSGWNYRVSIAGPGVTDQFDVFIPADQPTVRLRDLTPAAPGGTAYRVIEGPAGPPGATPDYANLPTLTLASSYDGGNDDGQPGHFDSTGRINLHSYQRAGTNNYGEILRMYAHKADSKQMMAWYAPKAWDPVTRDPIGNYVPVFWAGWHYESTDHSGVHGHWSVEAPDNGGFLQTRFEIRTHKRNVPFGDISGFGLDKTLILTNQADLVVRTSNGQVLRLASATGTEKAITFSHDAEGGDAYNRWKIRVNSTAESGGGAGSDFQIANYDDNGVFLGNAFNIERKSGNLGIGGLPGGRLHVRRNGTSTDDLIRATESDGTTNLFRVSSSGNVTGVLFNFSGTSGQVQVNGTTALRLDSTRNVGINNGQSMGGGQGVVSIANATTVPTANPTGGGILYAEGGELKWRGPSGTVTRIGAA